MFRFILKRLAQAVPVLIGVSVIVFLMLHLMPGDPAQVIAGQDASPADIEDVRQALHLDQPLWRQYMAFVGRLATGDLGKSFRTGRSVAAEIGGRYLNTLSLGAAAMAWAVLIGLLTGVASAVRRFSLVDDAALLGATLGISTPPFFLGLLLMLVFSVGLGWLPIAGNDRWSSLILPAATLGAASAAVISRVTRSSLIDVLDQDFIRTARAKGLREFLVIWRHALRNALIPTITVAGLQLGYLLGGAVVTETVFAWPGLGRLLVQSILARDFPVIQAAVLLMATTFVLVTVATDLLLLIADPRISPE
jgi:ABC-type dipeptide/oligopeptide/nickel transport system permease component